MSLQAIAPQVFTVFLCSPGDVVELRERARQVIGGLQRKQPFLGKVALTVIAWDDPVQGVPPLLGQSPQLTINEYKMPPSSCDLTVVLLWSRIGSPLPLKDFSKPDGSAYISGTEWETDDALRAGKDVLMYWWQKPLPPGTEREAAQRAALESFIAAKTRDGAGALVGGVCKFHELEDFEEQLSAHVEQWLQRRVGEQEAASLTLRPQEVSQRSWRVRWRHPSGLERLAAAALLVFAVMSLGLGFALSYVQGSLDRGRRARAEYQFELAARELSVAERGARLLSRSGLRGEALLELGKVASRKNELSHARELLGHARHLLADAGLTSGEAVAEHELGKVAFFLGELAEARKHYERAGSLYEQVVTEQGPGALVYERTDLRIDLATLQMVARRYGEVERILQGALDVAQQGRDRLAEANALLNMAELRRMQYQSQRARELLERADRLVDLEGSEHGKALVLRELATVELVDTGTGGISDEGRRAALSRLREALDILRKLGLTRDVASVAADIDQLESELKRSDVIIAHAKQLARLQSEPGGRANQMGQATVRQKLGQEFSRNARWREAAENLQEAAVLFDAIGDPVNKATSRLALARVQLRQGSPAMAEDTTKKAIEIAAMSDQPHLEVQGGIFLFELERERGQLSVARAHAKRAIARLDEHRSDPRFQVLLQARPILEQYLGDTDPGRSLPGATSAP